MHPLFVFSYSMDLARHKTTCFTFTIVPLIELISSVASKFQLQKGLD